MNFFHKTSSTRFWIRLRRLSSGHYEALLSGLTCQDVYDCLREEFEGKHLVLFSRPGLIWNGQLFSETLRAEYTTVGEKGKNPVYVISPSSVEEVLRAAPMNQNDQWWFFPYPKPITVEEARALELKVGLDYFRARPGGALAFFVASIYDLTVFTKSRGHIGRLLQKLFSKYAEGLGLLPAEKAGQMDFVRQMDIDVAGVDRGGAPVEATFTFTPDPVLRILKDTAQDRRRVVYEYAPETRRFERGEEKRISLPTLILENWGTIVVWLSSAIIAVGTIVILLSFLVMIVVFIINYLF